MSSSNDNGWSAGAELPAEILERMAEAAHAVFVGALRADGYRYGPIIDPVARTHTALRPYSDLPEDEKEQNRGTVRYIPAKLSQAGYRITSAKGDAGRFAFSAEQLDRLSELEHVRWVRSKLAAGWRYADRTDKPNQLHQSLVPWRRDPDDGRAAEYSVTELSMLGPGELGEDEREKDRVMIRGIPSILAAAGFTIVGTGA